VTTLQEADQPLASLLRLVEAASSAHDPSELAQQIVPGFVRHFAADAGALWLYAPPAQTCLYAYELDPNDFDQPVGQALSTGQPVVADVAAPGRAITHTFGVLPLTLEGATLGALGLLTAAPPLPAEWLAAQLLAAHLAARLQAMQARQYGEQRQIELAASGHGWAEFIGHAAHEIKNPLASVKGYADLLLRRTGDMPNDQFRKGLTIISQQVGRATDLLSKMSDTARIDSEQIAFNRQIVDLAGLLRRAVEAQQAQGEQHPISAEGLDQPIYGEFDEARLGQALRNILDNAATFSPAGSPIHVRVKRQQGPAGSEAVIAVRDQGVGVPAGEQREVFGRFKRGSNVRERFSGLGLGLFAARSIVERQGGRIWLESEPGDGTTCFVALPTR
jgi:signal transduction histidine kinase